MDNTRSQGSVRYVFIFHIRKLDYVNTWRDGPSFMTWVATNGQVSWFCRLQSRAFSLWAVHLMCVKVAQLNAERIEEEMMPHKSVKYWWFLYNPWESVTESLVFPGDDWGGWWLWCWGGGGLWWYLFENPRCVRDATVLPQKNSKFTQLDTLRPAIPRAEIAGVLLHQRPATFLPYNFTMTYAGLSLQQVGINQERNEENLGSHVRFHATLDLHLVW